MKKHISSARTSFMHLFSGIAKENHKKMANLEMRIKELEKKNIKIKGEDEAILFEQKISPLQKDLAKSSLIIMVFSAMAVEAYIYTIMPPVIWGMPLSKITWTNLTRQANGFWFQC